MSAELKIENARLRDSMYEAMKILHAALVFELPKVEPEPKRPIFRNPYKKTVIIPAPVIVDEEA